MRGVHHYCDISRMLVSNTRVAKLGQILQPLQVVVFGETFFIISSTSQSLGLCAVYKEISNVTLDNFPRIM